MTELAVRDSLPQRGLFDTGGRLDDLMWLVQMEHNAYRLLIVGIIKPDVSLKTVPELRKQLMGSYEKIIAILEEAKIPLYNHPELTLKGIGYPSHCCDGFRQEYHDMEATIRIEVAADWTLR